MSHQVSSSTAQPTSRSSSHSGSRRPAHPTHAGEGYLVNNLITFAVIMLMFLGAIFSLSFFDQTNVWPFGVCLLLAFLAFWIPQGLLGRSDSGPQLAEGERKA